MLIPANRRTVKRSGTITFDEFCDLVREDQKADLINGVIYMASPENTDANDLVLWLLWLISGVVDEFDLGRVFFERVAFPLTDTDAPEPDIAVVRKKNLHRVKRGRIDGPADAAFEIVSPESVERDYVDKRALYEKHRVREYWIIDEELRKVTVFRFYLKGKYREIKARGGKLHSKVLPGFWLRPEWLWQNPRPKKMAILREILERGSR